MELIFPVCQNTYPIKNDFFFILNNLVRNLQKICEIAKPKTLILKKLKTQAQTYTFGFQWVHMSGVISCWYNSSKLVYFIGEHGVKVVTARGKDYAMGVELFAATLENDVTKSLGFT